MYNTENFETLLLELTELFEETKNYKKHANGNFNKAELARGRAASNKLTKKLKEYRALSLQISKNQSI